MKKYLYLVCVLFLLSACNQNTRIQEEVSEVNILPTPKELDTTQQSLLLSYPIKMYSSHKEVQALLQLFQSELNQVCTTEIEFLSSEKQKADIIFSIDSSLSKESHQIHIEEKIQVKGGSYQALAMAKSSLLQLVHQKENSLIFPVLTLKDYPEVEYSGLMIDLARNWHPLESIKKMIDLSAFYKIKYLHLHFTDDQSFTLPSRKYPKLATIDRNYSFEDLKEMEAYAQLRGVIIIPEIDVPGHAAQFVKKYPEIFAIEGVEENSSIINMANEKVYEALEDIIAEMCMIFKNTPYFHIGGDEAVFNKVMDDPKVKTYIDQYQIKEDVHELYRHFINRMNKIVKKQGKQMCVWEGFSKEGEIEIAKDIIVFLFETNRYLPDELVKDGYQVVNTSWKPLYVVNQKKWAPKTIYNWNMWLWSNWFSKVPSYTPIQIEQTPQVIGAQMCTWEQKATIEIPSLRKRLAVFQERTWNASQKIPYETFLEKLSLTDQVLSKIIQDDRQDSLLTDYNFSEEMLK